MAPSKWASPEQESYLLAEDANWVLTKAGTGTLKNFYTTTTDTFLRKWPDVITMEMEDPKVKTKEEAIENIRGVSFLISLRSDVL
jgi:hypothetical protein